MCRETDLSANPSRAPLFCSLCIDFWAPQLMISAGMSHEWICTISVFGWCSYCTNGSGRVVDGRDGDDCKPYWSRVEIPTWFLFFSLIFVQIHTNEFIQLLYKLFSTNSCTVWFLYQFVHFLYKLYSTNLYNEPRGRSPSTPPAPTRPHPAAPTLGYTRLPWH